MDPILDNIGEQYNSTTNIYQTQFTIQQYSDSFFRIYYTGSGRYELVYDNTLTSTYDPDITIRWLVFEVIY